jgi:uncharacterized membrane protein
VAYRYRVSGVLVFRSLLWNLVLACVPFPLAWAGEALTRGGLRSARMVPASACLGLWLLFLPNAPYLVTDLVHLEPAAGAPLWYDALLYAAFAFTGLLLGYASVALVQVSVQRVLGRAAGWLVSLGALVLSAFGVYLGRVERWNSWNVVDSPRSLARRIVEPLRNPFQNPLTIRYTVVFAALLVVGYVVLVAMAAVMRELDARP